MRWFILLLISVTGCTFRFEDGRIDPVALNSKIETLTKVDSLIIEKLKELQDKGVLDKPKE